MNPCFGEEIFSAFEAATKLDWAYIRELAAFCGRGELEGDAPAGIRDRLDRDALNFDFFSSGAGGLDEGS